MDSSIPIKSLIKHHRTLIISSLIFNLESQMEGNLNQLQREHLERISYKIIIKKQLPFINLLINSPMLQITLEILSGNQEQKALEKEFLAVSVQQGKQQLIYLTTNIFIMYLPQSMSSFTILPFLISQFAKIIQYAVANKMISKH